MLFNRGNKIVLALHLTFVHCLPTTCSTILWLRSSTWLMEYYLALKNSDIMKFAGRWMELVKIIQSEVTQTQKDKHSTYLLISRY